jgi:hypothetical protein
MTVFNSGAAEESPACAWKNYAVDKPGEAS